MRYLFKSLRDDGKKKHSRPGLTALYRSGAGSLFIFILAALTLGLRTPGLAAPLLQLTPFPTPTPAPDGRIIYVVQPGDTLLRISLISGVPLDELRGLNRLTNDTIAVGQSLLLGLGGPAQATPTPGPSPTPTPILPTPSPRPGSANLCVLLYDDLNGDAIRQEAEPSIPEGAVSVNNRLGTVSLTAITTTGTDPYCFVELPEGEYNITVAIPDGYNPTTVNNYILQLKAGDETYLGFGAQLSSEASIDASLPGETNQGRSPWLGIAGGVLLLGGAGLAIFARRLLRGK